MYRMAPRTRVNVLRFCNSKLRDSITLANEVFHPSMKVPSVLTACCCVAAEVCRDVGTWHACREKCRSSGAYRGHRNGTPHIS